MAITPRLSLVTLGVADVAESTAFYERLGWQRSGASQEGDVSFFQLQGAALALWGRRALADDAGTASGEAGGEFRGVSTAINLGSEADVDAAFGDWVAAGGTAVKHPHRAFWGGYTSYVADLDGHLWEIAYNPYWPIDPNGGVQLPR